jgi:hypothetical protein
MDLGAIKSTMDEGSIAALGEGVAPTPDPNSVLPRPKTPEEAAKLEPGSRFVDPQGVTKIVPYRPKTPEEADALPEGSNFVDPSGTLRQVPKYEGIDFTAQTLYDMAFTDKERQKALERSYPGKVKKNERTGQFYVDDDGTLRKPKGFTSAPSAYVTALAAPTVASVLGEYGGAALGSIFPGAGTLVGAVGGGAAGGVGGQYFNDDMLQLAGVYDRTPGEEAENLTLAGLTGGVGTAAGRAIGAAWPAVKGAVQNALPAAAAKFLGATPEGLATAIRLRGQDVLVPPSGWAKEAPHIHNIVEVFDPAFHTQKPLLQSATAHYEKEGGKILETMGAAKPKSLSDPETAVSTEKAGEAITGRARKESVEADAKLRQTLEAQRAAVQAGAGDRESYMRVLKVAEEHSRAAADKLIDNGFKAINADITTAMNATKAGRNSGDLWQQVGDKLRKIKVAIGQRAKVRYDQADKSAEGHLPDISGLPQMAAEMLANLPEGFEGKYPGIIKQIRDLAGVEELDKTGNPTGKFAKEPVHPTFGQLHQLRTVLRNNINYYDLMPDFKDGALKFFANRVNEILHDKGATPELQAAAHMLDATDAWYGKVVKPLTDKNIQAVLNGLESGMPADPKMLYNTLVKEGRTELTNKVKKLVGPTLWAAVKAADVQEMLDSAKTLTPGVIDGRRFAQQVVDRYRSGMLEAVHGADALKLMTQARNIEMLAGRLDVPVRPGDTMTEVIGRARQAADAVKEAAKKDPLTTLNKEMRGIEREHSREAQRLRQQRINDPLGFLYKPTTGASEAVDKILGSEDLILATAARFGHDSPEFNMLRQVYAQRILQGTLEPSARLAKVSEEVQQIMFPGVTLGQMRQLAKDMDFLMSSRGAKDTAKSMAAVAKVEHPFGSVPGGRLLGKLVPGSEPIARSTLAAFYKMVRNVMNNPAFLRWIEKGLKGNEQARQMVKETVARQTNIGGALGAGLAESQYAAPNVP